MSAPSTFDDILASARVLIMAGGYNGFSYADIAAEVGVRKASIHHHFPTKVDLVRILVSQYREEARGGMADLEARLPDPAQQLRAYTGYWQSCIADASAPICICALLASEMPILPAEVASEVRAHFKSLSTWLATLLKKGVELGSIRISSSAQIEAELFMAAVHGAMLSARAYGEPKVFSTVVEPLLERMIVRTPA